MVKIPTYDRMITQRAQVADTVNPQAIEAAGAGFRGAAAVTDFGAQVSMRIQEEDDKATLNDAVISRERNRIDFETAAKKNYEGRPSGYAKFMETEMQRYDAEVMKAMPARMRQAYSMSAKQYTVRDYKQDVGWENERGIAVTGDKLTRAGKDIVGLAYTYGASGKPFEDLTPNIDATMMAGSGVLLPEKLSQFDDELRSSAAMQYLDGLKTRDPQSAQNLINSGNFSKYLTPEDMAKANKAIWDTMPDLMKLEQIKGSKQPLSVRNNNPGNIRGKDGAFVKYATPEEGQQAMANDLSVKIGGKSAAMKAKFGDNYQPTLSNLIHTWAPTNENDTTAYINTVAKETGIAPGQVLTQSDIPKLQAAMTKVEGGQSAATYFATGTAFDTMPYGDKLAQVEKIGKAIADDPAKAAIEYGATTPQSIIDVQAGLGIKPQYARVMSNSQAADMGARINRVENSDEIYAAAQEIEQTYGAYAPNAIADMKAKGDMKPAMEAALVLANTKRPEYKEHVELLAQIGKGGTDAINTLFASNGYNQKDLQEKIASETLDWQRAAMLEGRTPAEIQEKLAVVQSLAKARMSKALDGDYEAAVVFAVKPEMDSYGIAEAGGAQFRVPAQYSLDVIESAVDEAMSTRLPEMVKGSGDADYVYSNSVSPFLNPDENGVMFRTPMGEVVADKDGKPIDFKFDVLLKDYNAAQARKPKLYIRPDFGPGV